MAQRSVVIKIGEPDRSDTWEDDAKAFVDRNRDKIIADAIGMLQSPGDHLKQCSRWATWERSVLSCLPEPSDAQKAILEQQKAVDVEREEAAVIEEHFRHQLGGIGYPTETHKVFIPSNLAAQWFIEATGEKKSVVAIGRILSQLISEGRMASLQKSACNENGRGFVWYGPKSTAEVKIAKDIRARIAELLRQREEAARQDQLRRLRETAPST
jgi:hypothetical protein